MRYWRHSNLSNHLFHLYCLDFIQAVEIALQSISVTTPADNLVLRDLVNGKTPRITLTQDSIECNLRITNNHAIDMHVCTGVRLRRTLLGMS